MDRDTELDMVASLRAGDHAAFDAIYDALHPRLSSFLARLSRRRDVAEDLADEAWLRLIRYAPRLDPDTRLAPWLFTVGRNLFISYCRSRCLDESSRAGAIALWPFALQPAESPFEALSASETNRNVERALARLPTPQREMVLLVGIEGLTAAEAAAVCGISPDAARQRLSRARAALARDLGRKRAAPAALAREVTR